MIFFFIIIFFFLESIGRAFDILQQMINCRILNVIGKKKELCRSFQNDDKPSVFRCLIWNRQKYYTL
jgi:hypothetical protein